MLETRPFASYLSSIVDDDEVFKRIPSRPQQMACPATTILGVPLVLEVANPVSWGNESPPLPSGTLLTDLLMMDPDTGYLSKFTP